MNSIETQSSDKEDVSTLPEQNDKRWLLSLSTFCKMKKTEWASLTQSSLNPHTLSTLSSDEVWKRYYHIVMGLLNRYSIPSNSVVSTLHSIDFHLRRGEYTNSQVKDVKILNIDGKVIYVIIDEYSVPKTVITQSHYERLIKQQHKE